MISRRDFLAVSGAGLAAGVAPAGRQAPGGAEAFTFVHFTDTHLTTELGAVEACGRCFAEINQLRPSFAIAGGDQVRTVQRADEAETLRQYRLYLEAEKALECPVHRVVGNHDIRGTAAGTAVPAGAGKGMYEEHFGQRYYSFDHGAWHLVVLDSIHVAPAGDYNYAGGIDEAQLAWLKDDLASVGTHRPIVLATHVPLVSAWSFASPLGRDLPQLSTEKSNEILNLLQPFNVKAILQGHTHVYERVELRGRQYITTGAVAGDMWRGPRFGTPEGFSVCGVSGDQISIEYRRYQRA